ncbi:glycosyltransferase family 2 protein [Mangrovimonas cancribranchiae]|uniref:Glycosyltransferase family A protein n=1 Tax=Mangrovimonas cancribranchiae TaxID=3080055 RepID=A0AAU6P289_9FLAO
MMVSVILPIYNGESTLAKTLDSLVAQTYQEFEVIACIDGTTDGSYTILKRYESQFKAMHILINENNRGLGPTMNRLVAESKGDYIAIAEQDDYYYPNRLQLQVDVLNKNKAIGMVSGIAEFCDGVKISGKFPGVLVHGKQYPEGKDMFLLNYREQIKVVNSCMMFKKQVHIENGLYFTQHYPSISVDWTYVLRFSLVSKIHGLHETLVRLDRRINRNSVTSNKTKQFLASRELIRSFAYEYPNLISKQDYRFALNTQRLLELGSKKHLFFLCYGLCYWIISLDTRFFIKMKIKIFKKIVK